MKKIMFLLTCFLCCCYFVFSQTGSHIIDFRYSGFNVTPPCYLENGDDWKTSHGSPCYVAYTTFALQKIEII